LFTVRNLKQVDISTSAPPGLEARVAREQLEIHIVTAG
jgi:hypothetical protein